MARRASFTCPNCGEEVPAGARSCPECGSDETTGWSEKTVYDGTDIADRKEFNYAEFLEKEGLAKPGPSARKTVLITAVSMFIALLLLYMLTR